jgi:hypothetical protein
MKVEDLIEPGGLQCIDDRAILADDQGEVVPGGFLDVENLDEDAQPDRGEKLDAGLAASASCCRRLGPVSKSISSATTHNVVSAVASLTVTLSTSSATSRPASNDSGIASLHSTGRRPSSVVTTNVGSRRQVGEI